MKRLRKDYIQSATSGTVFYRVDKDLLKKLADESDNTIFQFLVKEYSFNAFDFKKNLFGSGIVNNVLYVCNTDGSDILVNGDEVDPESALEDYNIEELEGYIQDIDVDDLSKYLTYYELDVPDMDGLITNMVKDGYAPTQIIRDAKDMGMLDF